MRTADRARNLRKWGEEPINRPMGPTHPSRMPDRRGTVTPLEVYSGLARDNRRILSGGITIPPVPPPKRHPYDQWSPDARALDLVGDKWTLLIIRDLAAGPRRFVELQRVLPGHLDRAAALAAEPHGRRRPAHPPALPRGAAARGLRAHRALARADAGARRARALGLRLDLDARRARARTSTSARSSASRPGCSPPPPDLRGTVDLVVVAGERGGPRSSGLTRGRRARRDHRAAARARPTRPSTGSVDAWIGALGPDGAIGALDVGGKRGLAEALLAGFTAAATSRAAQRAA